MIWSVVFTSATTGFAVGGINTGVGSKILYTSDGGENWIERNAGTDNNLYSVYFLDALTGFASGYNGTIIKTTDGGLSWNSSPTGTHNSLKSIYCVNSNVCYVVGNGGTILKTTNGGATFIKDNSGMPQDYVLYQNYPNPFNPSTTIRYQLPMNRFVKLEIYDVLGREISQLVNEEQSEGSYSINFNAASLASGIYFYRLTISNPLGEFVKSKSMLLIK